MAKFLISLLFVLGLIYTAMGGRKGIQHYVRMQRFKAAHPTFMSQMKQALSCDNRENVALGCLDEGRKALELADEIGKIPYIYLRNLLLYQADIYWELHQFFKAKEVFTRLLKVSPTKHHESILSNLARLEQNIDNRNTEREKSETYHGAPGSGPAKTLTGKIAIAYVFIRDKESEEWSFRKREKTMRSLKKAEVWLKEQIRAYDHPAPTFVHKVVNLDRDPFLKRHTINAYSSSKKGRKFNGDAMAIRIAEALGYRNVLHFLKRLKKSMKADNAMVFFHVNKPARSFAYRCMGRCYAYGEFVMMLTGKRDRIGGRLTQTQAHEALHVFGADDLYNIQGGRDYATSDLMNYFHKMLVTGTIDPITAWSVGLQKKPPDDAPFDIIKHNRNGTTRLFKRGF